MLTLHIRRQTAPSRRKMEGVHQQYDSPFTMLHSDAAWRACDISLRFGNKLVRPSILTNYPGGKTMVQNKCRHSFEVYRMLREEPNPNVTQQSRPTAWNCNGHSNLQAPSKGHQTETIPHTIELENENPFRLPTLQHWYNNNFGFMDKTLQCNGRIRVKFDTKKHIFSHDLGQNLQNCNGQFPETHISITKARQHHYWCNISLFVLQRTMWYPPLGYQIIVFCMRSIFCICTKYARLNSTQCWQRAAVFEDDKTKNSLSNHQN